MIGMLLTTILLIVAILSIVATLLFILPLFIILYNKYLDWISTRLDDYGRN